MIFPSPSSKTGLPALLKAWDQLPDDNPLKRTLAGQIARLRAWDLRWSVDSVPTSLAVYWGEEIGRRVGADARKAGMSTDTYVATRAAAASMLEALAACGKPAVVHFVGAAPRSSTDRVRHVVQSCFNGKRVVIFSGGESKGTDELLQEIRGIRDGGGFGSIMGRNTFQRPHDEAIKLLKSVMGVYQGK